MKEYEDVVQNSELGRRLVSTAAKIVKDTDMVQLLQAIKELRAEVATLKRQVAQLPPLIQRVAELEQEDLQFKQFLTEWRGRRDKEWSEFGAWLERYMGELWKQYLEKNSES